ncbi:MAG: hypothetical protein B7Z80_24715 [Rhodospirillales bacterium 20-64-7]|nr:MAG: hypothetical protein B7Z80_24715 [Rhodospirillales bacterium 20-64-7]
MAFKSGWERTLAAQLSTSGVEWDYEKVELPYILNGTYHPDFRLIKSGILIEAKGLLDRESKRKMVAVKKQHPELDIRFLFMQGDKKIPGSKQTHGEWARKNGFPWAEGRIPNEWFEE